MFANRETFHVCLCVCACIQVGVCLCVCVLVAAGRRQREVTRGASCYSLQDQRSTDCNQEVLKRRACTHNRHTHTRAHTYTHTLRALETEPGRSRVQRSTTFCVLVCVCDDIMAELPPAVCLSVCLSVCLCDSPSVCRVEIAKVLSHFLSLLHLFVFVWVIIPIRCFPCSLPVGPLQG